MKDNAKGLVSRKLPVVYLPQEALNVSYIFQKLCAEHCACKCATGRVSSGKFKTFIKHT